MRFIFEVHTNERLEIIDKKSVDRVRKMMSCFEIMVNTTLPEMRVHLEEK
jgi:hypothetical protein